MENDIMIFNDQGGGQMSVTHNITATLRAQDHGHPPPLVLCIDQGAGKSKCNIYYDESPTLTTTHYGTPVVLMENKEHERSNRS